MKPASRSCSAYPGTPSTEIFETLPKYREALYCEWAPNEKVATEVAYGAAIGGVRSLCAMKHVGLNVAADPLFTAAYNGVNRGFVIVTADDPSMHSSQNEQDNRYYARAAKIAMVEPSDSQECLDFMKEAYRISEQFDMPVLFRTTTRVSHSKSLVTFGEREEAEPLAYQRNAKKYVCAPANAYIPTQYIAEYAKRIGYDGIIYMSSLTPGINESGLDRFNVVIFDYKTVCEVVRTNVVEVQENNVECDNVDGDRNPIKVESYGAAVFLW